MKGRPVVLVCALAVVVLSAGCAGVSGRGGDVVLRARGEAVVEAEEAVGQAPAAEWESIVQATGQGFASPTAPTDELKRLTALEAARHVALAALVEQIEGAEVTQRSMVRNMTFMAQELQSEVAGRLAGARVVRSDYDAATGKAEVQLMVGLDAEGKVVPAPATVGLAGVPPSEASRRLRAEAAARIDALAKLRGQLGEVRVGQQVRVRNLRLAHQEAWSTVEGILEGVQFGEPEWPTDRRCVVEASLTVPAADLERLRHAAGAP